MKEKPNGADSRGAKLLRRAKKLFDCTERRNAEARWQELAKYILHTQATSFSHNEDDIRGEVRTGELWDNTAVQANLDLSAAIHATITNPATKWSKLRYDSEEFNNDEETVKWLEKVGLTIHQELNESNFDVQVSKDYQMLTAIGTMALLHEVKKDGDDYQGFKFTALHLREFAFSENADGAVDMVCRRFWLTARQSVERWGKDCSEECLKAYEHEPERRFKYYHIIMPREKKDVKLNDQGLATATKRPYASLYIDSKNFNILSEDGFYEFPIYVVRWQTGPGEVYGRGPGHTALPEIKSLNKTRKLILQALELAVNPAWVSTIRNIAGSLNIAPKAITQVRSIDGLRELNTQARFDVAQLNVEQMQNNIRQNFFIDKLLLPDREKIGRMSAFEVSQRLAQMQRVLGPTLSRLNSEFLTPLIVRCFKVLLRENRLPPLPEVLEERGLNVEILFVNQLARAQQMDDIDNIDQFLQRVANLSQFKPQALDKIDEDGAVDYYAKVGGIPEQIITNNDKVEEIRTQRQQQMELQQQLGTAQQGADVAATLKQAEGDTGNEPVQQ